MEFTVRGLLLYVALASVSLALTQVPFLFGCGLLVLVVILINVVLPVRTWRFLVYGALVGILAAVIGLVGYLNLIITGPRTYTDGRLEVVYATRPYVVQVGALIGATAGFALSKRKSPAA
jgi:hypothetical protein